MFRVPGEFEFPVPSVHIYAFNRRGRKRRSAATGRTGHAYFWLLPNLRVNITTSMGTQVLTPPNKAAAPDRGPLLGAGLKPLVL